MWCDKASAAIDVTYHVENAQAVESVLRLDRGPVRRVKTGLRVLVLLKVGPSETELRTVRTIDRKKADKKKTACQGSVHATVRALQLGGYSIMYQTDTWKKRRNGLGS